MRLSQSLALCMAPIPVLATILGMALTGLAWVVVPVQVVTTFILGILASISFGLLLLPTSAIWIVLLFPMLGTSWLCSKAEALRNPLGVLGIPWAALTNTYACLIPSMGEVESRAAKLMLTESWPFTWEFWQFQRGRLELASIEGGPFDVVLARVSRGDPVRQRTLDHLSMGVSLDADV